MAINGIIQVREKFTLRLSEEKMFGYILPTAFVANKEKRIVCIDLETEFFQSIKELKETFHWGPQPFIPVTRMNTNLNKDSFLFHFDLNPFFESFRLDNYSETDIEMYTGDNDYLVIHDVDIVSLTDNEVFDITLSNSEAGGGFDSKGSKLKFKKKILLLKKKEFESKQEIATIKEEYELAGSFTSKIEKINNKLEKH